MPDEGGRDLIAGQAGQHRRGVDDVKPFVETDQHTADRPENSAHGGQRRVDGRTWHTRLQLGVGHMQRP